MITYTRGDSLRIPLKFKNRQGELMDLTGATFVAVFLDQYGKELEYNDHIEPHANQTTNTGEATLELADDETADHLEGRGCELCIRVSQNGDELTYRARQLECLPRPPRKPR